MLQSCPADLPVQVKDFPLRSAYKQTYTLSVSEWIPHRGLQHVLTLRKQQHKRDHNTASLFKDTNKRIYAYHLKTLKIMLARSNYPALD